MPPRVGSRSRPGSLSSEVLRLHQQMALLITPLQPLIQPEFPVGTRKPRPTPPHGHQGELDTLQASVPLCTRGWQPLSPLGTHCSRCQSPAVPAAWAPGAGTVPGHLPCGQRLPGQQHPHPWPTDPSPLTVASAMQACPQPGPRHRDLPAALAPPQPPVPLPGLSPGRCPLPPVGALVL